MSSMQNGPFGWLRRKFPKLLLFGCAVHVLDLLEEDIAKLFFVVSIVEKAKFIVVFVLRYSLIHGTFLELQLGRKAVDKSVSMLQLKTFPDTRFAYAVLMIVSVLLNWSVLAMIVDTADFNLCKRNVKPAQRRDFEKFEDFVQSGLLKRHCLAAREVMGPIAVVLSYIEGDNAHMVHIVPLFAILRQVVQNPPLDVTDVFTEGECAQIVEAVSNRWMGCGSGRAKKIGLRHPAHCLAYELDVFTQCIVDCVLGEAAATAVKRPYTAAEPKEALATLCGGNTTARYGRLLAQYGDLKARRPPYDNADEVMVVVKGKVAALVSTMNNETKANAVKMLVAIFKEVDFIGGGSTLYEGLLADSARLTPDAREFCNVALDIDKVIPHACGVERLNKAHDYNHSKSRASLAPKTIQKALFIFTNEALLHKQEHDAQQKTLRAQRVERVAAASDLDALASMDLAAAEDVLSSVAVLAVAEFLPAEFQGGTDDSETGDSGDKLEPEPHRIHLDVFEVPGGYVAVDKPAAFLGVGVLEQQPHYMLLCCDDLTWALGRIAKYKPMAIKYKFDVEWVRGQLHQQGTTLGGYYEFEAVLRAEPAPGSWIYLKNAAAPAPQRARLRDELAAGEDDENPATRHRAASDENMFDSGTER